MGHSHGIAWSLYKGELLELVCNGVGYQDIADRLGRKSGQEVTYDAVANAIRRFKFTSRFIKVEDELKLYREITIPEDDYIIGCDAHAPYYLATMVNRMLAVADKFKIKKHIHVGDLLDLDFAKKFYDDTQSTLDREVFATDPLINALDYFDMIYLIRGNHEKRIGISTDNKVQARHLLGIFGKDVWTKKFKYTTFDKIKIGKNWLAVHPRSYSQIGGNVAVRLAEKYHRHVLNAHGHFIALRYDRSGKYMGIDLGGLFDIRKIKYINETTTTHPVWNPGFGMIYQGKFFHFHNETNWEYWLG